jgi:hypothetical protein
MRSSYYVISTNPCVKNKICRKQSLAIFVSELRLAIAPCSAYTRSYPTSYQNAYHTYNSDIRCRSPLKSCLTMWLFRLEHSRSDVIATRDTARGYPTTLHRFYFYFLFLFPISISLVATRRWPLSSTTKVTGAFAAMPIFTILRFGFSEPSWAWLSVILCFTYFCSLLVKNGPRYISTSSMR